MPELHAGATAVKIPVAVLLRRVAEIGASVVALLRRRRTPDLSIVSEVAAFMHELGEILGEPVRPIHAEPVAVPVQRHKHRREVALVHFALCGSANVLSGDGAHSFLLIVVGDVSGAKPHWLMVTDESWA
ncbi:hypothetical protein PZL22_000442 (plasmid) [Sinorhizobium kummerowiae]|nr:hypothetical protein [Sinorhizobium kummerowiae]WHS91836.1 hypothetical protein PZL22_000442 [Sinorhizobium kummerowiae]